MKILLINNNPVVSRLTALSARKEDIEIDEVQEVTELTAYTYDIVFVDADSWNEDVKSTIFTHIETKKRVLFYSQDDNENLDTFDKGILKPFLPSEVSAIIRSVEGMNTLETISDEIQEEKSTDTVEEIKDNSTVLSTVAGTATAAAASIGFESPKSEKELMDELTKIDEAKVEKETLLDSADLEDNLFNEKSEELKIDANDFASKSTETELFDLDLKDDKVSFDDELFTSEVKTTDKVLDDEILEFDLAKEDELNLDNKELFDPLEVDDLKEVLEEKVNEDVSDSISELKPEVETKVLDAGEIETIKEILEEDTSDTIELDDLVAPGMAGVAAMALSSEELQSQDLDDADKKKKKKSKKEKKVSLEETDTTLVDTLSNLKVESLKELLAGATVTINIQFPKA